MIFKEDNKMAKKVMERIVKVINIIINVVMGTGAIMNFMNYAAIDAYVRTDDLSRLPIVLWMFVIVNAADYFIRKAIREF